MRVVTFGGGHRFVFLSRGERAPDPYANRDYGGMSIIWQRKSGKWDVRDFDKGEWIEITDQQFDTENEAFNCAYDRYTEYWDRIYSRSR